MASSTLEPVHSVTQPLSKTILQHTHRVTDDPEIKVAFCRSRVGHQALNQQLPNSPGTNRSLTSWTWACPALSGPSQATRLRGRWFASFYSYKSAFQKQRSLVVVEYLTALCFAISTTTYYRSYTRCIIAI